MIYAVSNGAVTNYSASPGFGYGSLFDHTTWAAVSFATKVALIADGGSALTAFPVGTVTVWNDASNLTVTYDITLAPWVITETHVDVQTSASAIPQTKKGNPKVGKFAYKSEHASPGVTTYTETIPLANIPALAGDPVVIAAQAVVVIFEMIEEVVVVVDEESAWGEGLGFDGRNWAMYFEYTVR